jgi:hypothetical protein
VTTICMPDHIRDKDRLNCSRRPSPWMRNQFWIGHYETAEAAKKVAEKVGWNGRSHVANVATGIATP